MATFVPAKRATEFIFYTALTSTSGRPDFQVNPTLAAGDVKVITDGGTETNLDTLPVVTPASGIYVKVTVSVAEMTGDNIALSFIDAAGAEWDDQLITLQTAVRQIDDLAFPATSGRSFIVETDGMIHGDIKEWLGAAMSALISGRVDANAQAGLAPLGTTMRGTDSAALAAVCTAARLGELDPANLPADIDEIIADVTGIAGAAMRGTDSAATAAALATVQSDTDDIQTRLPASLVGGRIDASVGAMAANVLTAAAINAAAFTAAKFATDSIDANALAADAAQKIRDEILPTQNVAFPDINFLLVAASDHVTPVTGATGLAVTRSINSGSFGAGTGTLAEIGNGMYQYDASAADMNGGKITFRFTASGGTPGVPDDRFLSIITGGGV